MFLTKAGFESQKAFQPKLLILLFYILFVCKCVLYYCHRVSNPIADNKYINIKININIKTEKLFKSKRVILHIRQEGNFFIYDGGI